jgi:hypothetical protein
MKKRSTMALLLTSLLLTSACRFVALDPGAEQVEVRDEASVAGCQRLGRTTAQVMHKVLVFRRGEPKMSEELATLARNSATEMEGNAVAALGPIQDGRQEFGIYRCPTP